MKKSLQFSILFLFFLLCGISSSAQSYKTMMHDYAYNFYEVVDSAESYFQSHDRGKGSGYKGYLRWKNENESKFYPSGDRTYADPYLASASYNQLRQTYKNKYEFKNGWVDLGPYDADNITSHYSAGIGRVEAFYVDPTDYNTLYLGSRSGGFWRTTDEGANWINTTDFLPASGVNCIAVSPFGSDTVLINVRNASNGNSHGIYQSVDGGISWNVSPFNPTNLGLGGLGSYFQVYKVVCHPSIPKLVMVGTNYGLYRSTDGLATWTRIRAGSIRDIEFHPTDPQVLYVFDNNQKNLLLLSDDAGLTFTNSQGYGNSSLGFISVTPESPDNVYLASSGGIWKSVNRGKNLTALTNPDESCYGFAVSDIDSNVMLYGYVDLEVSTDGGDSFNQTTSWSQPFSSSYIHADIRTLESINGRFYVGTDGYFCKSTDKGTTWTKLNNGTGIRENYRVGVGQSNWRVNMCGSQDNGTSIYFNDDWIEWNGGDGMEAVVHSLNENYMIGSWQYGSRNRTINGGQSRIFTNNPERGSSEADWIAPLLTDPLDHMRVYHFGSNIYVSDSFGIDWKLWGSPGIGIIKVAAISQSNPDVMVVCRNSTIRLTIDGGQNFTSINNPDLGHAVTYINFDPSNDSNIVITYDSYAANNRKIYMSHDRGSTWQNITYNLGNMPLKTAVIDFHDSSYIYVGAEIGVYYKSMEGTHWNLYNNKLPNVTVKDLKIHRGSNSLRAATWGRGLWEYSTVDRNTHPSILHTNISDEVSSIKPVEGVQQFVSSVVSYEGLLTSVYVKYSTDAANLDIQLNMTNSADSTWTSTNPIADYPAGTKVYFQVHAIGQNQDTSSSAVFMYTVRPFLYCDASGTTNTTADYIQHVELNGMLNVTDQGYYTFYKDSVIVLNKQENYTLTVGLAAAFDKDTAGAWVDFNKNGVFDSSEHVIMSAYDANHFAAGTLTIPSFVSGPDTFRLRIRNNYFSDFPNPCGEDAGEVEDYTVVVVNDNASVPESSLSSIRYFPNPTHGNVDFKLGKVYAHMDVKVWNIHGQEHSSFELHSANQFSLNFSGPSSIYFVQLQSNQETRIIKVIVN